jgi:serine phosphatase RsbU (regulator of sigma subunit)
MNRIVVIEDDPAILRGLATSLRLESFEVLTAADGNDGFRMVRDEQPDLVILDLMLPGMNGYEVCREVRRHGLSTPILMLTAQAEADWRVEGFDAGADDYVIKPFSVRELVGRVRAILRRSEGRSDLANQRELHDARNIQERLMPADIPQPPGLRIAGTCRPARIAGGDYFDVIDLASHAVAVCIGDVCGKGMPAALMMANLQAAVRTCASKNMRPRDVCEALNRLMCDNLAGQGFITFFYAVLDKDDDGVGRCVFCNAGHNPPMLFRFGGDVQRLDCGGAILGVRTDWHYDEQTVRLDAGDRLLMYSDGLTESRSPDGEEFGDRRLIELVRRDDSLAVDALIERALAGAAHFSGGRFDDDVTVVAVAVESDENSNVVKGDVC